MYRRNIQNRLTGALSDSPVVLLNGARQVGKSTLAQQIVKREKGSYFTMDDATLLAAATSDPPGFISGLDGFTVIDEVQKVPGLFPAIKMEVDGNRQPGRFLLTGSANVLLLPQLSESLAGRMEIITLWPFSRGELLNKQEGFIDRLFSSSINTGGNSKPGALDISSIILAGGYPEALERNEGERRQAWFNSYITTILQRDVRDLANIEGLTDMPRLLALLAARTGSLLNISELSRSSGIPHTTLRRYLSLLQTTFLLQLIPAWSTNLSKRLVKSQKVHLVDCGLAAHLMGLTDAEQLRNSTQFGHLFESFIVTELLKQSGWNKTPVSIFHFRASGGAEVDIVLEDARGRLTGIEVKASANVAGKHFKGLYKLAEMTGNKFHRGVVIYLGKAVVPFSKNMHAFPATSMWENNR